MIINRGKHIPHNLDVVRQIDPELKVKRGEAQASQKKPVQSWPLSNVKISLI